MKKLLILFFCIAASIAQAQSNQVKATGISYTRGAPNFVPNENTASEVAIDTITGFVYQWHRTPGPSNFGGWRVLGQGIDVRVDAVAPTYVPFRNQSVFVVNAVDSLYYYHSGAWHHLNKGGGSTYTAGTGIAINGSNVISNTAPDQTVSITGGGINSVSGAYPNFTVIGTEVDGSTTNEIQNLSLTGQSLGISSGTGVTLPIVGVSAGTGISVSTTTGTATVTNTGDLSTTNELNTSMSVTGGNLRLTDAGGNLDVAVTDIAPIQALTAGSGISISGAGSNKTITATGGAIAIPATEIAYGNGTTITSDTTLKFKSIAIGGFTVLKALQLKKGRIGDPSNLSGIVIDNGYKPSSNAVWPQITIQSPTKDVESWPFAFVQQASNNIANQPVSLTDTTWNQVMTWGFNPGNAFGSPTTSKPSVWYAMEPNWYNGSKQKWIEFHQSIDWGTGEKRFFTNEVRDIKGTPTSAYQFLADQFFVSSLSDGNNNPYWRVTRSKSAGTFSMLHLAGIRRQMTLSIDSTTNEFLYLNTGQDKSTSSLSYSGFRNIQLRDDANEILLNLNGSTNSADMINTVVSQTAEALNFKISTGGDIKYSSFRFLSPGPNGIDFFAGRAAGPNVLGSYSGTDNTLIGPNSGYDLTSGKNNVCIGRGTLRYGTSAKKNVFLGSYIMNSSGASAYPAISGSVIIGDSVAFSPSFDPSNKLIIDNTNNNTPLLSGDFSTNKIGINIANAAPAEALTVSGNFKLQTAGNKIFVATGTNASAGTATLVGGTVTVSTTAVTSNSLIFLSMNTPGGTLGYISSPVASITNGTSFVINSSSATDASTVNWWLIN